MVRVRASSAAHTVMEGSGSISDPHRGGGGGGNSNSSSSLTSSSRWYGMLSASSIIQAPISSLLEYSGLLRTTRSNHQENESLIPGGLGGGGHGSSRLDDSSASVVPNNGEVSIRIIGAGEHERDGSGGLVVGQVGGAHNEVLGQQQMMGADALQGDLRSDRGGGDAADGAGGQQSSSVSGDGEAADEAGGNGRDSTYQRYDIQQVARWIEQVLPFSLLLLVVFIRQHLQGFFVTIGIAVVMFKSNDILRKQTALKGERKISVLVGISLAFMVHVVAVYWWYQNDDLLYPLIMLPPKSIPPFWHAIFIIMVNDTLVRQAAMAFKCVLLIYYKNSRGRNYRRQGQMLTLVEYLILLYRALLPAPVWYRFFLNKEYGSLFSSLMTGLYLTFKLTSFVEKVQSFFSALKALSRKEVHYGAHATSEQVNAAGDLCAICQEKMHAPILLRCKHIFCEDCVSEWFERERTCPLCRALVKPADLRSFGDGSTSLLFQMF
ncbi:RING finger and transmembrane domain-containing protein 2-like isoform X2 [Populus alba x Populus x berolinensis]|uniref:RING finger and transmembrane domain-containing protein 2-like isoform X2 n=1 Tax=Populus alba x Populus x berolinensis TaxID=444605 RepID=A0AAD6LMN9_9ROSI|nr:RING finger and transmembrane domain-containing protein 2-like isoform X2 [Populus alba x Populus x berolinensis]